mmetsp:Transcript_23392/g.54336  ORF Transcript_23392/g.54336 Transcript_23392/m.54336 type:complete len:83 (-) Transcript_23392:55-303(-)
MIVLIDLNFDGKAREKKKLACGRPNGWYIFLELLTSLEVTGREASKEGDGGRRTTSRCTCVSRFHYAICIILSTTTFRICMT